MNIRNFAFMFMLAGLVGCTTVDPGTAGIVVDWNGTQETPLPEGFHTINPITDSIVHYSTKVQAYDAPASAMSNDLQVVNTQITINYKISAADTPKMLQEVGMLDDVESKIIRPIVHETLKKHTAKYSAEGLITSRELVTSAVTEDITDQLAGVDITVTEVSLTDFEFDPDFQEAVERKQIAEQDAKTATNKVEIARAEAEEVVVRKEADARALLVEAEAQAEANRLLTKSLSPAIIKYEAVQKWDGHYPKFVGGDGADLLVTVE